jgi:hypothetical protein
MRDNVLEDPLDQRALPQTLVATPGRCRPAPLPADCGPTSIDVVALFWLALLDQGAPS